MFEKDYYQILGVSETASDKEIKRAFHRLARKYHPDKNKSADAEKMFKEMNEAYQVLSDSKKREEYDRFRKYGPRAFAGGGKPGGVEIDFGGFNPGGFGSADFDFSDIFSSVFGGAPRQSRRKRRVQRGFNIKAIIEIQFETALKGGKIPFKITRQATCETCKGSGSATGEKKVCPQCNGRGVVQLAQGGFALNRPCPVCGGEGSIIENPCKTCNSKGFVNKTQTVEVNIPKGINSGQKIRLSGLGNAGENGAPAGDLILEVHLLEHPVFTRKGRDIHSTISIDMIEAALGTKKMIETVDGNVELKIPSGTQPGIKLRLRGKGVETTDIQGDHYITVQVNIPKHLTDNQRELLKKFKSN